MLTKFIKPYLSINNINNVAYIRDVYSWEEIELVYSDDLKDLKCQLLFYGLKFLKKWHNISPGDNITYCLQFI
jgi:hypothetical protein